MSNVKNFGLVGVGSNVQFGKGGSKIVLDEGTFKLRNAAGAADVALTAGNITSSGTVTAASGGAFTFGDASLSRQAAGVVKFDGSAAFVAPTGNDAARPTGVTGAVRVNTQAGAGVVEFYNGSTWKTLADTGITSGIQTELDAVETALGTGYNTSTDAFNAAAFTADIFNSPTSFTSAINQVADAVAAGNNFNELFPATAAGNVIYATGSGPTFTWAQAGAGSTSGVQAWDAGLDALAAKTSTGLMVQTGDNTYTSVTIAGTSGNIVVTNGSGVDGAPTINLAEVTQNTATTGKSFVKVELDSFGRVIGNTAVTTADITALVDNTYVNVSGDTMAGNLSFADTYKVTNLAAPTQNADAATKLYVDNAVGGSSSTLQAEVDAIETALGAGYNTSTDLFDGSAFTGDAFTSPTSFTNAIQQVANYATSHDALSELVDVTISSATNKDLLQYNSTTSKWENKAIGSTSGVQAWDAALDALAAKTSTGIMVQTGADTYESRSLVQPASGITISDADGVAGNPTFALANDLAAIEGLSGTGFAVRTGNDTWAQRSITGTADRIVVTNGDGVASSPTIDLATVTQASTGNFVKVTLDGYGRVTGNTAVTTADITALVDNVYVDVAGDTMTGNLDFGNAHKVTGLAEPTAGSDAATKNYVDNAVAGMTWKAAVNVFAVANVSLSGSLPLVIDGYSMNENDGGYRILLTGQTDDTEDGIYQLNVAGTGPYTYTLTRTADADTPAELEGATVFVLEGTTYGNTGWTQSNHYLTTFAGQTWVQFAGGGAYTAGDGINVTGTVISAVIGDGLVDVDGATTVKVSTGNAVQLVGTSPDKAVELVLASGSGLAQSASGLTINTASVTNAMLQNSSLTLDADSGTGTISLGGTLNVEGTSTQGIQTSVSGSTFVVTALDASTSQKGVASFNSASFETSSGAVSIKAAGVSNSQLANSTITFSANTGTADAVSLGQTIAITGSGAMSTAVSDNAIAISVATATNSVLGVASFSSDSFDVAAGAVSIKSGGVSNAQLANSSVTIGSTNIALGGTSTTLAGLTQVDIDNLRLDGNTISSTDTNGNISLIPNGTGQVVIGTSGSGVIAAESGQKLTITGNNNLVLESTSGDIEMKVPSGTTTKVTVTGASAADYATGLADADLVNKKYVDDAIANGAAAGAIKAFQAVVSLTGGAVTLGTMPAGATVLRVKVNVTAADTGSGTLVVGKSGSTNAYMSSGENDVQETGLYVAETFVTESGSVAILATPSGASAGSATVIVEYQVAQA